MRILNLSFNNIKKKTFKLVMFFDICKIIVVRNEDILTRKVTKIKDVRRKRKSYTNKKKKEMYQVLKLIE